MLIDYIMNSKNNINAPMVEAFTPNGVIDKPFTGGALCIMGTIGVYKIVSKTIPDRIYIGSTTNIELRWREHRRMLRQNVHSKKLQEHFDCYGLDDFAFHIIELCGIDSLNEREQYHIDINNPYFNIIHIVGNPVRQHDDETKRVMSEKLIGNKRALGVRLSEERIEQIRKRSTGRKASEETRRKLSLMRIGNTWGAFNKGIKRGPLSEETKKKLSIAITGKRKGIPHTAEHCRRISEGQRGQIRITKKSIRVINVHTGIIYPSLSMAAKINGITVSDLNNDIKNGKNKYGFIRYKPLLALNQHYTFTIYW